MKKLLIIAINLMLALTVSIAKGDEYKIDIEGMHAAINFKVRHIGISWLSGRFDKFDGYFFLMKVTRLHQRLLLM